MSQTLSSFLLTILQSEEFIIQNSKKGSRKSNNNGEMRDCRENCSPTKSFSCCEIGIGKLSMDIPVFNILKFLVETKHKTLVY